ncbi:MAG: hypothetical protein GF411_02840 [Candidatus Lokiarchaeota archaeon]|nr:hypothetical protein [Candidatus Lokiarchaeota archaeon]
MVSDIRKIEEINEIIGDMHEAGVITDWEVGFVEDQVDRIMTYGTSTKFTQKQINVIDRIYEKACVWD